jgi:hypothetical protein
MGTEVYPFGDKATIIVHTTNTDVYRKLKSRDDCIKTVPYTQGDFIAKPKVVAYDLYFPVSMAKEIKQIIKENK